MRRNANPYPHTIVLTIAAMTLAMLCSCHPTTTSTTTPDNRTPQEILFDDGNFAMFIHFGLYSKMEGEWQGKRYYGNAEWIKHQAGIPADEYMKEATTFNPDEFDAEAIVKLAKDAGMKYIVITSKHHEGFAMFDSDFCDFNICDATPLKRDLMKELADACHANGLGIGFYYSQWQDWTAPGGAGGPSTDADGRKVTFEEYFRNKCIPQVNELTTKYGEIQLIWFDTPGELSKAASEELVALVRKNQPNALVSSRVGNGVGDYDTLNDMQVPLVNHTGRWEGIDVMQVGWGFSKFDDEWKSPSYIVRTLVSVVARGGNFLFNIGPDSKGRIPEQAAASLRAVGKWVRKYPQVVYGADASPWGHALPWGDVVTSHDKLYLVVFDWPQDGKLWLPGLHNNVKSARIVDGATLCHRKEGTWTCIETPFECPDRLASVIELTIDGDIDVDNTPAVNPNGNATLLPIEFATVENCEVSHSQWMEKFGEWKFKVNVGSMTAKSKIQWTADFKEPGYYDIEVECKGEGTADWMMTTDEGNTIVDRHNLHERYEWQRLGWMKIDKAGKHKLSLSVTDANCWQVNIGSIRINPVGL